MHFLVKASIQWERGRGGVRWGGFNTEDALRMDMRGGKAAFVCLSVMNKGRRAGERVLLTTMCAGDGDLASLSACLL